MTSQESHVKSKIKDIISRSPQIHPGPPARYQLVTKRESLDGEREEESRLRRWTFGERDHSKVNKTILLVGETGTGKSTMINALVNYVMEVEMEDKVWFEIVEEGSSSASQTSAVTVSEICAEGRVPFSLTMKEMKDIMGKQLQGFLKSEKLNLVVMKADANQIYKTETFLDSVVNFLGKDMENNTVFLINHSDRTFKAIKDENKIISIPKRKLSNFDKSVFIKDYYSAWKKEIEQFFSYLNEAEKITKTEESLFQKVKDKKENRNERMQTIPSHSLSALKHEPVHEDKGSRPNDEKQLSCKLQNKISVIPNQEEMARQAGEETEQDPENVPMGKETVNEISNTTSLDGPCNLIPAKYAGLSNIKISIQEGGIPLCQLVTKPRCLDGETEASSKLKRLSVGEKITNKPNKTILLVGETGSGKSSLIDTMVNYVMGVKFDDNVRFTIGKEKESQSESQTSAVTVYNIYPIEDSSFPFDLTIIDTPGYGDTRGIVYDKAVARTLHHLFRSEDGVHKMDAVGFVLKASENRLSDRQFYILDAVISLFGKDIKNIIVPLITHSDGGSAPNVIQALKVAKIPCAEDEDGDPVYFLFNNRKIDVTRSRKDKKEKEERALKRAWETTQEGMEEFFEFLKDLPQQEMVLTVDVLDKRIQIEALVTNYQDQIKFIELKQAEHMKVEKALKEQKEGCAVTVDEPYKEKVLINAWWDTMATICTVCEENCHYPGCTLAVYPAWCIVMKKDEKGELRCTVCTKKCTIDKHVKGRKYYVIKTKKVMKTYEDLLKENGTNVKDNVSKNEILLDTIQKSIEEHKDEQNQLVEDYYQNILKLQDISIRGNSVVTYVHLDFLIEKMKESGAPDRDEKVQKLEEIKREVEKEKKGGIEYLEKKQLKT